MPVLLATAYFPPIEYIFALSASARQCNFAYIEACENYQKQSYRNRCELYSASGKQTLSVPVVHDGGTFALPIRDIRIDYSKPWVRTHIRSIVSAYGNAAFFDYYWGDILSILAARPVRLWDLNLSLLRFFLDRLGVNVELRLTSGFIKPSAAPAFLPNLPLGDESGICDLREAVHPKKQALQIGGIEKPYFQVFAQKHGFIPNLSIMDLLFNEGPEAGAYFR